MPSPSSLVSRGCYRSLARALCSYGQLSSPYARLQPSSSLSSSSLSSSSSSRLSSMRFTSSASSPKPPSSPSSAMKDEYGSMDSSGRIYSVKNFPLESGEILPEAHACFNTYGELNGARDNVIVVCHALTGNSRVDLWWDPLLGPGKPLDTSKYMIMCANVLGSCYGSSGPTSINPSTGTPYGIRFPHTTIRDSVNLHIQLARVHLGVSSVACVVGGSMGGMQAIEWGMLGKAPFVRKIAVIGCGAAHTAWQIGISETQRLAIRSDPKWLDGKVDPSDPPSSGLALARQIAMISYRTAQGYEAKFGRSVDSSGRWQVRRYLEHQGDKFVARFDAISYVKITEQMDTHDVGRGRGGVNRALADLNCRALIMGIDSDVLYPLAEQKALADNIPGAVLRVIKSTNGHDGFLLEHQQVGAHIKDFLDL